MPVPPLPLEVVGLIVDSLADSLQGDWPARRENGKNVALVCRAWRSLGANLAWRHVFLETREQQDSLVKHLRRRKNLGEQVRTFEYRIPEDWQPHLDDLMPGRGAPTRPRPLIHRLDKLCPNLRAFSWRHNYESVEEVFYNLAHSPLASSLRRLSIGSTADDYDRLLDQLANFPNLDDLAFDGCAPTWHTSTRTPSLPTNLLRIRTLKVHHTVPGADPNRAAVFLHHLLPLLDPTSIRKCSFFLETGTSFPLEWLVNASSVTHVRLYLFQPYDSTPVVLRALSTSPAWPNLSKLTLSRLTGSSDFAPVVPSPLRLAAVLDKLARGPHRKDAWRRFILNRISVVADSVEVPTLPDRRASPPRLGEPGPDLFVTCSLRDLYVDGANAREEFVGTLYGRVGAEGKLLWSEWYGVREGVEERG
ncbi:hypothetical protein JCM8097_006580 [Rhodosporidiobolus ruineniae]